MFITGGPGTKLCASEGILLAVEESDHLTLVNAGDEEVVSQEGGEKGGAAGGEGGGPGCSKT
jgi:hypothetical protein